MKKRKILTQEKCSNNNLIIKRDQITQKIIINKDQIDQEIQINKKNFPNQWTKILAKTN